MNSVQIFGLPYSAESLLVVSRKLISILSEDKPSVPTTLFTPNAEQVVQAQHFQEFFQVLKTGTLLLPDGYSIVLASRLQHWLFGTPTLPERVTGIDLVATLLQSAPATTTFLLIGGREYVQNASTKLSVNGRTVWWLPGYKNVHAPTTEEEQKVTETINKIHPDIVFVAFGAPQQEFFVRDHFHLFLNNNIKIVLVVGGAFDVLTGKLPRAPLWLQKNGGEWLFRLWKEPWRLKRQLRLVEFWLYTLQVFLMQKIKQWLCRDN